MTGRQPITFCPLCNKKLDAWTPTEEGTEPSPGDVSICAYCLALLIYKDDLTLRLATREETLEIADQMGWTVK